VAQSVDAPLGRRLLVVGQVGEEDLAHVRAGADPVATRYDTRAVRYEATVLVAAINEWL